MNFFEIFDKILNFLFLGTNFKTELEVFGLSKIFCVEKPIICTYVHTKSLVLMSPVIRYMLFSSS